MFRIYPYMRGSRSAIALRDALQGKLIKLEGSGYRPRANHLIINWGNSSVPNYPQGTVLNPAPVVQAASNKLRTFELLQQAGVRIPEFTTVLQEALNWQLADDRLTVVERHKLTGNSGDGIRIVEHNQELSRQAKMYVKYIKKQQEYRVHVVRGQVIDVQRKARKQDVPDDQVNWKVRNLAGGFIFAREGVTPDNVPQDVINQAKDAVVHLGLDFGAVDVVYNQNQNQAYVLEINTACGLEGTTLVKYTEAFQAIQRGTDLPAWEAPEVQQVQEERAPEPNELAVRFRDFLDGIQGNAQLNQVDIELFDEISVKLEEALENHV